MQIQISQNIIQLLNDATTDYFNRQLNLINCQVQLQPIISLAMQLQTDPEIVLNYHSEKEIKGFLKLSNPIPNMTISFKIKTTKPFLFQVNPSKGYLGSNKIKQVQIFLTGQNTPEDLRNISMKEKFLIQYIIISDKMKQEDLEAQWKKKEAEGAIKKQKLKIKPEGVSIYASGIYENKEDAEEPTYKPSKTQTFDLNEVFDKEKRQQEDNKRRDKLIKQAYKILAQKANQKQLQELTKQYHKKESQKIPESSPQNNPQNMSAMKLGFTFAIVIILLLAFKSFFGSNKQEVIPVVVPVVQTESTPNKASLNAATIIQKGLGQ